jgi:NTP pyrophosphatase (non-canonical NTP hydrolase)
MPDNDANLKTLKEKVSAYVKERDWEQYHNPKDLSMSISIEAAEPMECFQWKDAEERPDQKSTEKIREELADVAIYSLSLANALDIDVSDAIIRKLEKNAEKSNTPAKPEYVPHRGMPYRHLQTGTLAVHYAKYPAGL